MTFLITVDKKHICNIEFNNVIGIVIICKVFISIVVVPCDTQHNHSQYRYAEYRILLTIMLGVVMRSAVRLNVIVLCVMAPFWRKTIVKILD
jgi:hypothetical protein